MASILTCFNISHLNLPTIPWYNLPNFYHHTILPTRIFSSSSSIDNIFCNLPLTTMSDKPTCTVLDYLPQFLILPEFFGSAPPSKYNIYTHDWEIFDEEKFLFEFNS